MAATAVKIPFSDATPAEIREVLLPEELPEFERQYRRALEVAAETFSLDELGKNTLRTGQSPPGSVPWNELKARLGR